MSDGPSEGQYQAGQADPPAPEEGPKPGTIGALAAHIRQHGLIDLSCALTLLQVDTQEEPELAAAYKACWKALKPYSDRETQKLQEIVEAYGPEGILNAPVSLQGVAWKRVRWSGTPVLFGWRVRLGRHTTAEEKKWLHASGFDFSGGWWGRRDEA